MLLGEALIARAELAPDATRLVENAYHDLLQELRSQRPPAVSAAPQVVLRLLRRHHLDLYKALYHDLASALVHRGGDCRARTELIVALLYDAGFQERVSVRVFANHLAPVLHDGQREHRFGMVADCNGLGLQAPALELLTNRFPDSRDRCHPARPLMGPALRDDDPPPSWSGREEREDETCPLAAWPWRETGTEITLVRDGAGTPGDEAPVIVLEPSPGELEERATGVACHARTLDALRMRGPPGDQILAALGRAVAYGLESALWFAAAGELDSARWLENEVRVRQEESQGLLEHWDHRDLALRAEHSSLVHLGPAGQTALLELAGRHRCWSGSDVLAILIREPATSERALALYWTRTLPQQIEVADRMYWMDDTFLRAVAGTAAGRRAIHLRAAVGTLRDRWQSCSFRELQRLAVETMRDFSLGAEWVAPFVAVIGEDAPVHLRDHGCRVEAFMAELNRWGDAQSPEIRAWLGRQTREGHEQCVMASADPSPRR